MFLPCVALAKDPLFLLYQLWIHNCAFSGGGEFGGGVFTVMSIHKDLRVGIMFLHYGSIGEKTLIFTVISDFTSYSDMEVSVISSWWCWGNHM